MASNHAHWLQGFKGDRHRFKLFESRRPPGTHTDRRRSRAQVGLIRRESCVSRSPSTCTGTDLPIALWPSWRAFYRRQTTELQPDRRRQSAARRQCASGRCQGPPIPIVRAPAIRVIGAGGKTGRLWRGTAAQEKAAGIEGAMALPLAY